MEKKKLALNCLESFGAIECDTLINGKHYNYGEVYCMEYKFLREELERLERLDKIINILNERICIHNGCISYNSMEDKPLSKEECELLSDVLKVSESRKLVK